MNSKIKSFLFRHFITLYMSKYPTDLKFLNGGSNNDSSETNLKK